MCAHDWRDPLPRHYQERQDWIAEHFLRKIQADAVARLLESLIQPKPPVERVNLADISERRLSVITGLGYVAGLADGRRPFAFSLDDLAGRAWTNGWRQGREHRARAIERELPFDVLTAQRLRAVRERLEPVPR